MKSQPQITLHRFGSDSVPVVVVDGFARDPDRWKVQANSQVYKVMGDFFPGRRSPVPSAYFEDVGPLLGGILRSAFGCKKHMSVERALYSIVSTPPAQLKLGQRVPHIDNTEPDRFAMVHYLSPEVFEGTAFYRHRSTGFEVITQESHQFFVDRLAQEFSETGVPKAQYIEGDTPLFQQIGRVDYRYNRAVIYPGNLLHCSLTRNDRLHPDDPLTGRLTVAAFMLAR